ncbi:hypothetical protein PIB30_045004 [Stylosanthes scabra]|uniref:DUF4283 domain-containing protein n=1 Tax=Stylosanthes scabra TaxID=79078 RepID=A0ABU6YEU8_9FABA|nr:hypothetical protein [Stylosanthes scabra]
MGIWDHPKGVIITDVGRNSVLISFQDRSKGFRLWRGGPWSIRGHLVNRQMCSGNKSLLEIDHKYMEDPTVTRYKPGLGVNRAKSLDAYEEEDVYMNTQHQNLSSESESEAELRMKEHRRKPWERESGNKGEMQYENREKNSGQVAEKGSELQDSKEQAVGEEMEIQGIEEQIAAEEENWDCELEDKLYRKKVQLARMKGKCVQKVHEEKKNSYSVEQELMKIENQNEAKVEEGNMVIEEILKIFQLDNQKTSSGLMRKEENKQRSLAVTIKEPTEEGNEMNQKPEKSKGSGVGIQIEHQGKGKELMKIEEVMKRPVKKKYKVKSNNLYYVEMPDDSDDDANEIRGIKFNETIRQEGMEPTV